MTTYCRAWLAGGDVRMVVAASSPSGLEGVLSGAVDAMDVVDFTVAGADVVDAAEIVKAVDAEDGRIVSRALSIRKQGPRGCLLPAERNARKGRAT